MSDERSADQAQHQFECLKLMVDCLHEAEENGKTHYNGEDMYAEQIRERIQEDPLEILVRSDWHQPGQEPETPHEFNILLCTGGPAVRIVGRLYGSEPQEAHLEHQDWGTPWTVLPLSPEQEETLLAYASVFYFGN